MDNQGSVAMVTGWHPAPLAFVHRTSPVDAFPTSWRPNGPNRFTVLASWPPEHPFYSPVRGRWYDPILVVETMRQSTLLAVHAGYGVPVGYHFVLNELTYACRLDQLAVVPEPMLVEVDVVCVPVGRHGLPPTRLTAAWEVRRDGRILATGSGSARLTSPRAYERLRGHAPPAVPAGALPDPVSPEQVGRTRVDDVLLARTSREGVWRLRVNTGHRRLFQRPNDHIPGMLLLEAARQAAGALVPPAPFVPTAGGVAFHRYAELGRPCHILAEVTPSGAVRVTGQQEGALVFECQMSSAVAPIGPDGTVACSS